MKLWKSALAIALGTLALINTIWSAGLIPVAGTFVRIRSASSIRVMRSIRVQDGFVGASCFSSDDQRLVFYSVGEHGALQAVDVRTGRTAWSQSPVDRITGCTIDPARKLVLTADENGVIQTRRLSDGSSKGKIGTNATSTSAAFSINGALCALSNETGVEVLNLSTGKLVFRAACAGANHVALDRNGRLLACTGSDGGRIWRVSDGRQLLKFGSGETYGVALSSDGCLLAYSTNDNAIHVIRSADGKTLRTLPNGVTGTDEFAFSLSGKQLLIAGYRGYLWDLGTGRRRDISAPYVVNSVAYSPNGKLVATGENFHPH